MSIRSRLWVGIGLTGMVGIVWFVTSRHEPEPIYQGQKLSFRLALGSASVDENTDKFLEQNSAIVTRYLARALYKSDNVFWRPYVWLTGHVPVVIRNRMPVWVEPRLVRAGGCYWLAQLGPRAVACAERLRKLGNDDLHPEVRQSALWALGRVDAPTKESLSAMIRGLATDPDAAVRRIAAGGLEIWKADDPRVIPSLIQALSDLDPSVQQISAATLGSYGRRALPAMEPLKKLAAADAIASDYAARALDEINQDTAAMTSPAK